MIPSIIFASKTFLQYGKSHTVAEKNIVHITIFRKICATCSVRFIRLWISSDNLRSRSWKCTSLHHKTRIDFGNQKSVHNIMNKILKFIKFLIWRNEYIIRFLYLTESIKSIINISDETRPPAKQESGKKRIRRISNYLCIQNFITISWVVRVYQFYKRTKICVYNISTIIIYLHKNKTKKTTEISFILFYS